ncbi:serine/threonine-protein kinase [Chondromyces apiculatus]|uniref:Serine/threonine protein kinase n=1 Tax=Chondromyces apiculatus DSM 436 TaxID=1192034 RepID=A0A017TF47_9BACT|nr:serine/threonine-protein kinase [Chondromyces apiculatus]EYF07918.1 serine/threonine protein kinase [Chondromyces apiculatus DSM 436]
MKACPSCQRLFPDDGSYCPIDGERLLSVAEAPVPTDADDPRVGKAFCGGRYQIRRVVADGGTGRVYQALDLKESRSVALKILHTDVVSDEIALHRFRREFEVSSALLHDHIIKVFAFERTEDQSFALVMEYLEGEELRSLLKREKTLPPERVIRMVSQLALGLAAAHARKVVHRDLKPDNVFLVGTREGDQVKILDFGSVRDNSEGAKKLTAIGTTIGSPFYMSPEQAQALPTLDHRADIWSIGAIIYECLAGTVPFRGTTGPAILLAILTDELMPPSVVRSSVPRILDPVMARSMTKEPEARTATAAQLADEFGHAYGLTGDHQEWAYVAQEELAERIAAGLPGALTAHDEATAARGEPPGKPADASDELFRAGSLGGPVAFQDDLVMGMPRPMARWLVPTVATAAVLVGVVIAFLIAR